MISQHGQKGRNIANICSAGYLKEYIKEISIDSCSDYKKFVENNIDYQRELKHIRKLMID